MEKVARFEKVTLQQFTADAGFVADAAACYQDIRMPRRATVGSAGYDIFAPFGFSLEPEGSVLVPTGLRALIDQGWVLQLYPRSSYGFKYRLRLDNTVGIIDADYSQAANQGHIMIRMTNGPRPLTVQAGDAIAQGIFVPFGITYDDQAVAIRHGGFGSTGR